MQIAYLGPKGSFSHQVAQKAFPKDTLVGYETITEVMKAYEREEVMYSIVPVENSIEGSVHETLDYLFHQANIRAVAEIVQPIKQQLLATAKDKAITTIFSHPQAIAQGKKYITHHYPKAKIEVTASTAYAARLVAAQPEKPYAAIAPRSAAREYHLEIIAEDIQEIAENNTRFWVLGKKPIVLPLQQVHRKCSLALTLPDNLPGSLYKAMSVFAWRGIDLTKIESRPLKTTLGEYFFILDVDNTKPERLEYALKELTSLEISYKILGDYFIYPT